MSLPAQSSLGIRLVITLGNWHPKAAYSGAFGPPSPTSHLPAALLLVLEAVAAAVAEASWTRPGPFQFSSPGTRSLPWPFCFQFSFSLVHG